MAIVPLADDVRQAAHRLFSDSDRAEAVSLLAGAKLHDGSAASPRMQRCALVASSGSLQKLCYYVKLLAVDYRDVILAAEYEVVSGKEVRARDLDQPLPSNFRWSGP